MPDSRTSKIVKLRQIIEELDTEKGRREAELRQLETAPASLDW